MSSSLDDLEPYELFQQELDEYLKAYEKHLKNTHKEFTAKNFLVLHQFIEYICFIKSKSSFEEIFEEEIKVYFIKFLDEETGKDVHSSQAISALKEYFIYIDLHQKTLGSDLLNRLQI